MIKSKTVFILKHAKGRVKTLLLRVSPSYGSLRGRQARSLAVVIHLFYPEMWPGIARALNNIEERYDLFITTPPDRLGLVEDMLKGIEGVNIISIKNRGRDVLPFLGVLRIINGMGYTKVLKLHSKKSTHRLDGAEWYSSLITSLLPSKKIINEVLKTLDDPNTGIIGPASQYLDLSVNFEANGMHMSYGLKRLIGKKRAYEMLHSERSSYGFFAGSMFWARVDALEPLLDEIFDTPGYYEKESGQIDGTFAHAIERLFSLCPEGLGRKLYEVSAGGVKPLPYNATSIPSWSDIYVEPAG